MNRPVDEDITMKRKFCVAFFRWMTHLIGKQLKNNIVKFPSVKDKFPHLHDHSIHAHTFRRKTIVHQSLHSRFDYETLKTHVAHAVRLSVQKSRATVYRKSFRDDGLQISVCV